MYMLLCRVSEMWHNGSLELTYTCRRHVDRVIFRLICNIAVAAAVAAAAAAAA